METREYKIDKVSDLGIWAIYYEKKGQKYLIEMVFSEEEAMAVAHAM